MGARGISAKEGRKPWIAAALGAAFCLAMSAASLSQPTQSQSVQGPPAQGAAQRQGVQDVRFGGDSRETRVVIEMDRAAHGKEQDTAHNVAVVQLADIKADEDLEGRGQGLVGGWAFDRVLGGARLTLQLTRPAHVARRFLLPPADGVSVYRYVIDLAADDPNAAPAPAAVPPAGAVAAADGARLTPAKLTHVSSIAPLRLKKVIVIDAGHGGKDPGARGASSWEKDVNLAAALELKAKLEKTGRYKVVMTRSTDTFVKLEDRVQIARRADADLFISLHSDSGPDATTRGATVYTLSDKGSDRVVRGVMGQSDWFINVDLPGRDRAVNAILLDLTQRATRNRSAAFAEDLLDHIADRTQLLQHSHRDAGFMVLLAPDVPAVLLEMGFITNTADEALLNDPGRRTRLMGGVAEAIDAYFAQQTQIAAR